MRITNSSVSVSRGGSTVQYTLDSSYVPVDGNAQHLQGYKYGKVLPNLMREAPPVRERLHGHLGFQDLSRLDASFCNSHMDLVGNKRFQCLTKSVSAEFFLYHLHIGF